MKRGMSQQGESMEAGQCPAGGPDEPRSWEAAPKRGKGMEWFENIKLELIGQDGMGFNSSRADTPFPLLQELMVRERDAGGERREKGSGRKTRMGMDGVGC